MLCGIEVLDDLANDLYRQIWSLHLAQSVDVPCCKFRTLQECNHLLILHFRRLVVQADGYDGCLLTDVKVMRVEAIGRGGMTSTISCRFVNKLIVLRYPGTVVRLNWIPLHYPLPTPSHPFYPFFIPSSFSLSQGCKYRTEHSPQRTGTFTRILPMVAKGLCLRASFTSALEQVHSVTTRYIPASHGLTCLDVDDHSAGLADSRRVYVASTRRRVGCDPRTLLK